MSKTKAILEFLKQPQPTAPTIQQIGAAVGLANPSAVLICLSKLEKAGLISAHPTYHIIKKYAHTP